jgi:hypothetical protein
MGLFIGPVVLSLTMAVFDMLEEMNFSSPSGQRRYPPSNLAPLKREKV